MSSAKANDHSHSISSRSLMYTLKNVGDKTDPCGVPLCVHTVVSPITSQVELNADSMTLRIACGTSIFPSFPSRILLSAESKAFARSRKRAIHSSFESLISFIC